MRYLFSAFLILISVQCQALSPAIQAVVGSTSAPSCTACTGGLIFAAYFEDASGNVTLGTPCGCSVGDTTGAAADSCTITGGYADVADGGKYFAWDVSSTDIFDWAAGSMLIEFVGVTAVTNSRLFSVVAEAAQNQLTIYSNTDEIFAMHEGADAGPTVVATSGASTVVYDGTTHYYIVLRWDTADVDPNFFIGVYNGTTDALIDSDQSNGPLTAWDVEPGAGTFHVGNDTANDGAFKIYKVLVWDSYAGAPSSGFAGY